MGALWRTRQHYPLARFIAKTDCCHYFRKPVQFAPANNRRNRSVIIYFERPKKSSADADLIQVANVLAARYSTGDKVEKKIHEDGQNLGFQ